MLPVGSLLACEHVRGSWFCNPQPERTLGETSTTERLLERCIGTSSAFRLGLYRVVIRPDGNWRIE